MSAPVQTDLCEYIDELKRRELGGGMNAITDMFPEASPVDVDAVPNERYTTPSTIEWVLRKLQIARFDLDVAACAESHWAERYYTQADDGLAKPWDASRVWCNPPYDNIAAWVKKAEAEVTASALEKTYRPSLVAMLIPANRTEQPFWQRHIEPYRDFRHLRPWSLDTHFVPGRTVFGYPGNPTGNGVGSPPFACVLLVWRAA